MLMVDSLCWKTDLKSRIFDAQEAERAAKSQLAAVLKGGSGDKTGMWHIAFSAQVQVWLTCKLFVSLIVKGAGNGSDSQTRLGT